MWKKNVDSVEISKENKQGVHIFFKEDLKGKNEEKVTWCALFGWFGLAHKKESRKRASLLRPKEKGD